MFTLEKKVWEFAEKYKNYLFLGIITLLALGVRYSARDIYSDDMFYFLAPWYEEIREAGGLGALKSQVGNYNIVYQTIIALLTYININCVYAYKIVSVVFDFLLAFASAVLACELMGKKKGETTFCLVYAAMLFLPTVVLNSAFWAQCDSIYTFFVILTVYYLYKEKYVRTFVFLGIAFAFKLQTVFILPLIICYYLYKKKFSILMLGISVAVFWLSGIPAYIAGRPLNTPFLIYMNQADQYHYMYMNIPNFWMLFCIVYDVLNRAALIVTIMMCGLGLYMILIGKKKMDSSEQFMNTAAWFVWTCVMFLPAMHERYTFMLDIFLILLSFVNQKYIKYAVASSGLSLFTYNIFLFGNGTLEPVHAWIFLTAWMHYSYFILKQDAVKEVYCS